MQFRVSANKVSDTSSLPAAVAACVPKHRGVRRGEDPPADARRIRRTRSASPMLMLLNGSYWHDPITEKPVLNTTEIWSFVNPTDDTHPIHLHAVRFQILDRQRYDALDLPDEEAASPSGTAHPARARRGRMEGHGARRPQDGDAHHRALRRLHRTLRLALPHRWSTRTTR